MHNHLIHLTEPTYAHVCTCMHTYAQPPKPPKRTHVCTRMHTHVPPPSAEVRTVFLYWASAVMLTTIISKELVRARALHRGKMLTPRQNAAAQAAGCRMLPCFHSVHPCTHPLASAASLSSRRDATSAACMPQARLLPAQVEGGPLRAKCIFTQKNIRQWRLWDTVHHAVHHAV